ncbi:MAG: DUF4190 domain-containing protein [Abditibacteriales bacterium]|nr:DUF4190 domain-containing protein [Abditibacteriales bacterium]
MQEVKPSQQGTGLAVASLVVGILSLMLICCAVSPLTGLVAVALGVAHMRRSPAKRGLAIAGISTGAVGAVLGILAAMLGVKVWRAFNTPPPPPPPLPTNFVVRPTFTLKDGRRVEAGTAFGATMDGGEPVLLSALHLLGQAGGLDKQIPAEQVPDVVTAVTLFNMDRSQRVGVAGKGLLREGFPIGEGPTESDCRGDIVAFQLSKQSRIGVAPLAKENPPFLSRVWVVGKEFSKAGAAADLLPGLVWMPTHKNIVVVMQTPFDLSGFSGAPAVNEKGAIVGMVVGGSSGRDGRPIVLLNPVADVRKQLESVQRE